MRSSITKPMIVVLLLCLVYYAFACWTAYGQLGVGNLLSNAILFGSGFAGFEISFWLLMPFSKDVRRALGVLLGINGAISGIGWIFLAQHTVTLFLFIFGFAQFLYFSCVSLERLKPESQEP